MKRIAILTAGGDTPALNATLHGAVTRANQFRIEMIGLIGGFSSLVATPTPYVPLNPLFAPIPELDPTKGGTILGSTREYLNASNQQQMKLVTDRLRRLEVDGLICIGGDGTLNGMQTLADSLPVVLAPKTIDNDLGLNYSGEADQWQREETGEPGKFRYTHHELRTQWQLEQMVNYVTPGYATAVYVAASGVMRVRTTAESHRRIAIIEVMGRDSGYIALGSAYGQPDLILLPEHPVDVEHLIARTRELYLLQENVVIVCGEGIVDQAGNQLGAATQSFDPSGNVRLSGAAEAIRRLLIEYLGDSFFKHQHFALSASEAIFTRKVGHTQRGGRPLAFDRFHAAQLGGKAVDLLVQGENNVVATLDWREQTGFDVGSVSADALRDRWGGIHARRMHGSFYDPQRMLPSQRGIEYLLPIFTTAIGPEDVEYIRQSLFDCGNLIKTYHSVNKDIRRRIRYAE